MTVIKRLLKSRPTPVALPSDLWRDTEGDLWEQTGPDEYRLYRVGQADVPDNGSRLTSAQVGIELAPVIEAGA